MAKMTEEEKELFEERIAIITIDGQMPESYARIKAWKQIEELRKKKEQKDERFNNSKSR